jgi:hypothetical protein
VEHHHQAMMHLHHFQKLMLKVMLLLVEMVGPLAYPWQPSPVQPAPSP